MDPDALKAIGAVITYFAGVVGLALAVEGLKALIWGVVFLVVLKVALKKHRR